MRIDRNTAIGLAIALAVIFGLAGWGHLLGLEPGTLDAVRTFAAAVAAFGLAAARSLLSKDEDKDGIPDFLQKFMGVLVVCGSITAGMWLSGCGVSAVQSALSAQAQTIRATQPVRFEGYQDLHVVCMARTRPDLDAYRGCMRPAEGVARASDSFANTLRGAQHTLDLAEGDADVGRIVACVIESARDYLSAAESAGAPIPDDVRAFANMIPEGLCDAD